jgi:hypothetical protein
LDKLENSDVQCPKCNEINQLTKDGSRQCWNCGEKIPPPKKKTEKKAKKRTFGDNMRQLKFNMTTIRANLKFVYRAIYREVKYFLPIKDLIILFSMIAISIIILILMIVIGFPMSLDLINKITNSKIFPWEEIQQGFFRVLTDPTFVRTAGGLIGAATIIIRLMIKSPIMKYKDKVNTRKDITYIFGSSRTAEQLLHELVQQYGYEERVSLQIYFG